MADWYYVENDVRQGPVEDAVLLNLWKGGTITADTLIWKNGMKEWLPAGQIVKQPGGGTPPPHPRNGSGVNSGPKSMDGGTYCRSCGKTVMAQAVVCPACGCAPKDGREFCRHCGKPTHIAAKVCIQCGGELSGRRAGSAVPEKQMTAFLLCLFLGVLGIHRFYLKIENAIVMLLVSVFTFGLGGSIWGLIDMMSIASGRFRDGEGELIGESVNWMVIVAWCCIGFGILGGLMILLSGCAAVLGG